MYARLTTFRVKPDKIEDMKRWREENQADIFAQPGLRQWVGLMGDDGEAFVVSLFDDKKAALDAMPFTRKLWSGMAPMLEGEPTARYLDVMAVEDLTMRGAAAA